MVGGPLLGDFAVLVMVSSQYVFAANQQDKGPGRQDIVVQEEVLDAFKAGQHVGENFSLSRRLKDLKDFSAGHMSSFR